jgi:class 3 adenylate cyclase/putative methionine-R-sulfoxide reductase with GAF domain
MKRRSSAGRKPIKAGRKPAKRRRNVPKATPKRGTSIAGQETVVARLTHERDEALLRETANSEILRLISKSPGDLELVFRTILEDATRICNAKFGNLFRFDGENFYPAAQFNTPAALLDAIRRRGAFKPTPGISLDHVMRTKQVFHSADMAAEPVLGFSTKFGGARSQVTVPMLKDDALIGAIVIYRQEVLPFTDKQISLVQNFAAQAVIAIENTRLLSELRQRTDDLSEALEQQTATSEVLRVVSSSAGDLQPVFEAILANATRICDARFASMFLRDGDAFRGVATTYDAPRAYVEARTKSEPLQPSPEGPLGRVAITKEVAQVADLRELHSYLVERHPFVVAAVELGGFRTALSVPMLKDNELLGAINILRQEVRPFTEKQIELVKNFAAQAVIAIENARLLNELRQSLEQQTATADVLRIISSSPGNLERVFDAMLASATRLCEAGSEGSLTLREGNDLKIVARHNPPAALLEATRLDPIFRPGRASGLGRSIRLNQVVQVPDMINDQAYIDRDPARVRLVEAGYRSQLSVPLIKDNEAIGAFNICRKQPGIFTEKQIELVKNFAAQAVIAIENARLLSELRQRTQEVSKLNQQLEQRVADQVGEIERMGRLRRFLPPQVADLIVASGSEKQLESHRREITALFCDLRGFTGFSESSDPEDVMSLLAEYHAAIGTIINKYSGTLERYAGDGVMVIFNDPVPVENPALQAVLMALDMRAAIGSLIEKWRDLGHDLGFGIGIAHGFATLGTIGFEGRRDYAAIGTVSNVASRLCDEAKPGQILISPRVRQAVEKGVTVEPVGEFALKGIRRPMTAYNVLEAPLSRPS